MSSGDSKSLVFFSLFSIRGVEVLLGIAQALSLAYVVGATAEKDAYDIAFHFSMLFVYVFGLHAFSGVATSLFARLDVSRVEDPSNVFSSICNIIVTCGLLLSACVALGAQWLIELSAPGFGVETSRLAAQLLRTTAVTIPLMPLSAFLSGVLASKERLLWGPIGGVIIKVGMILGAVVGYPRLGVFGLAWGLICALLFGLVMQVIILRQCGFAWRPVFDMRSLHVRIALGQVVPFAGGMLLANLGLFVINRLASLGPEGTVACYNYARTCTGLVTGMIAVPLSSMLAPPLSSAVERGDRVAVSRLVYSYERYTLVGLSMVATLLLFGGRSAVAVALERGRFTSSAAETTGAMVSLAALGLLGGGLAAIATQVLLAHRKAWGLVLMNSAGVFASILASYLLTPYYGALGLAAGMVAGSLAYGVIGWVHVLRLVGGPKHDGWTRRWAVWLLAGSAASFGVFLLRPTVAGNPLAHAVLLLGAAAASSMMWVFAGFILEVKEATAIWYRILSSLRR